ncbi:MAG: carboxymuconolactone decarboxylase family protein [Sedimentisphaerales bacterium]|nr:carboxymuconolactone decarboxylase family protein [Sedimentisphaerales bacterium]
MNTKTLTGMTICLIGLTGAILVGSSRGHEEQPAATDMEARNILSQLEREHGFVPKALRLMSERQTLLPRFMAYGRGVLEGGPLSDKERSLVALAAAVALKSPECTAAHSKRARKSGATDGEIIQATLIAGLISNTSALHIAQDSLGRTEK